MNPIQTQVAKLWDLLFSPTTGETYKKALLLTWDILRESARLVWLVLCLGFIFVDWARVNSVRSGQELRQWYDNIEEPKASNLWNETGRAVLAVSNSSLSYVMSQARTELGIPAPVEPPKLISPNPTAKPAAAKVEAAPAKVEPALAKPPVVETSSTPSPSSEEVS